MRQAGRMGGKEWDNFNVSSFTLQIHPCIHLPPCLLSSNYPHAIFECSYLSFPSLLWGDVTLTRRWKHLAFPPACFIYGLTRGSREILNGGGLAAERLPLSNYMTASREGESCGSAIPSWCLISHSFSYWIFLFKAAPLMLAAPSSPRHWDRGKKRREREASSKGGKKAWIVSFTDRTYWRKCRVDCIT